MPRSEAGKKEGEMQGCKSGIDRMMIYLVGGHDANRPLVAPCYAM